MTIHFVYAVPKAPGLVNRLRSVSARFLGDRLDIPKFGSDRSNPDLSWWPQPCYSPFSITAHLLPELRRLAPVRLYDWQERTRIQPDKGDILLGLSYPDDPD